MRQRQSARASPRPRRGGARTTLCDPRRVSPTAPSPLARPPAATPRAACTPLSRGPGKIRRAGQGQCVVPAGTSYALGTGPLVLELDPHPLEEPVALRKVALRPVGVVRKEAAPGVIEATHDLLVGDAHSEEVVVRLAAVPEVPRREDVGSELVEAVGSANGLRIGGLWLLRKRGGDSLHLRPHAAKSVERPWHGVLGPLDPVIHEPQRLETPGAPPGGLDRRPRPRGEGREGHGALPAVLEALEEHGVRDEVSAAEPEARNHGAGHDE